MAVSLQPRLPGQMCSTVEKAREISKTTLDHLRRILSDHDYLKHSAPDQEDSEEMSRVLTEDEPHVGQKNVKSDPKDNCSSSASHDSKVFIVLCERTVFLNVCVGKYVSYVKTGL